MEASCELMSTLRGDGGSGLIDSDALASLVASRTAQAAAAGAELAIRSPSSAPPTHSVALKAWVATHRAVLEESVAAQTAALGARRADVGARERECALERNLSRRAAREARLERDKATVERIRVEEAFAKADREARAEETALRARLDYEAKVQAELIEISKLSASIAPLRAMEAQLSDRARDATRAQNAAYETLESSVTFPPLPLPSQQGASELVLAAAAVGHALGEEVLIKSLGSSKGGGGAGFSSAVTAHGITGASLLASSPRVAQASSSFRAAADDALNSTLGGSLLLGGSGLGASRGMGTPSYSSVFQPTGSTASPRWSVPQRWGGGDTQASYPSPPSYVHSFSVTSEPLGRDSGREMTSSRALSPSRGKPRVLPVSLWPTSSPNPLSPLKQTLQSSHFSSYARGGELPEILVTAPFLPQEGRRSPRDSTLRASPIPAKTLEESRTAVSQGLSEVQKASPGGKGLSAFSIIDSSFRIGR